MLKIMLENIPITLLNSDFTISILFNIDEK